MKRVVKRNIIIIVFLIVTLTITTYVYNNKINKNIIIDKILESSSYAYLPDTAKDYIKEIYEISNEVILTEKNKKENTPYLNPEYIKYLELSEEEQKEVEEIPTSLINDYIIDPSYLETTLPTTYDLRDVNGNNYTTPVRNQGKLGLCWAFTSAETIESYLLKSNNETYTTSSTLISERQMDYASASNGITDYDTEYTAFAKRELGGGGNFFISSFLLATGVSNVNMNSFKEYSDTDYTKEELNEVLNYNNSLNEVNSTSIIYSPDLRSSTSSLTTTQQNTRTSYINEVKENLYNYGGAYVGTYMGSVGTCYYTSTSGDTVLDVYNCNYSSSGHAMQLIGWDDNYAYTYCADSTTPSATLTNCSNIVTGSGAWILKNSWGTTMPYIYLTYDSYYTTFGFVTNLTTKENRIWDNNYVLGSETGTESSIKSKTYSLSNTKIKDNEILKQIKFIAASENATYTITVSSGSNTYQTVTTTKEDIGLLTVDLSDKNMIIDNTYSIKIESAKYYLDKILVFTSNQDANKYISTSSIPTETSNYKIRLYSDTKNIASGSEITYKIINSNREEVTNYTISNNIVAENNVNTLLTLDGGFTGGEYTIEMYSNNVKITSTNINFKTMAGSGTKSDPYIITNAIQFDQIRNDLDAYYELANDIDMTSITRQDGDLYNYQTTCGNGFGWNSIKEFSGHLDGKNHKVIGLYQKNYIKCTSGYLYRTYEGGGIFATVVGDASIENLILEDFDITCSGGYCAPLISKYINNDIDNANLIIKNVAIVNSTISGLGPSSASNYIGGLLGYTENSKGNLDYENIYIDIKINYTNRVSSSSSLLAGGYSKNTTIKNILINNFNGKTDASSILVKDYVSSTDSVWNIENIISTVNDSTITKFTYGLGNSNFNIKNSNIINNTSDSFYNIESTNVNIYDRETELSELTKEENYQTWDDFEDNWVIKTISGIKRIPMLKFMDFEYTEVEDITINQVLNQKYSIYDYITPTYDKDDTRITFKSNNENIVTIDEDGYIIPRKTGTTTIHIESLYDGYIKDVPISITYVPHYTVILNPNGGVGDEQIIEVSTSKNYTIPSNPYTYTHYNFINWNTLADGTGTSYNNLATINSLSDKEIITLYAIWQGEDITLTFDPNGGTVTPTTKDYHYGDALGDYPIPIKDGSGFMYWYRLINTSYFTTISSSTIIKASYTYTAKWLDNAYTIIYNRNGATGNFFHSYAYFNSNSTLKTNTYTKENYVFDSWNTKEDGTGTKYTDKATINLSSVENSVLNLYAQWKLKPITITFDANGGSGTMDKQEYEQNETKALSKNTYTRTGYTFIGWNTLEDGTGTDYEDEQIITPTEDLTLYAKWESYNIINSTKDEEVIYDDLEHTITIDVDITDYNIVYSIDNINYTLTQIPKYKEVGEYTIYYKITKEGYDDLISSNKLKIYGISSIDSSISIKNNIIITNNNSYNTLKNKFNIYSKNTIYTHLNINKQSIEEDNIKTGDYLKININNTKDYEYSIAYLGDVNGDGEINIIDYIRVMKDIMNTTKLSTINFEAADMNRNNQIDIIDYIRIMNKIMED